MLPLTLPFTYFKRNHSLFERGKSDLSFSESSVMEWNVPGGLQRADGLGRDLEGTLGQAPTSFWGVLAYFLVYLHFFYIEIMTENVQRCKKLACGFLTGLSFGWRGVFPVRHLESTRTILNISQGLGLWLSGTALASHIKGPEIGYSSITKSIINRLFKIERRPANHGCHRR